MGSYIVIYSDWGVSQSSCHWLVEAFHRVASPLYKIKVVDHHFFMKNDWHSSVALVVFPGGRDRPYQQLLKGRGNASLKTYVEGGGCFLGICAGGYYGAAYIEFEKGSPWEILEERDLAFFPGKAVGPAYGGFFHPLGETGAKEALISWDGKVTPVYYNGGCFFEEADRFPTVKVLGYYHDIPSKPAALVYCRVKKGGALLSGIHPEYATKDELFKFLVYQILI